MRVWIYGVDHGEFEKLARVEDGSVVEGDETVVAGAFPEGIPEDEEEVAKKFTSPPVIATTDFEMDWTADRPEWADQESEG